MLNQASDTLAVLTTLLNLPDVTVTDIRHSSDGHSVTLVVQSTRDHVSCQRCGKPACGHGSGRTIRLRHLSLLGKKTYIELTPRRGRCEHCDDHPTTTESFDWYSQNSKLTKPYEQYLLFELINSTVSDVSAKEGIDYHTVEALIDRHVSTEVDFDAIQSLGVLGLDEISLKKGYRDFVTLVTYRSDDKVHLLAVLKGREKATVQGFLKTIPGRLRKTIRAACCDLYEGYINACKEAFGKKVPVVADRFHVRKLYMKSLVSIRKAELKRLKRSLDDEAYQKLKPAIAILRKQKDYFTDDEKRILTPLFQLSPKLKLAYQLSHQLTTIFNSHVSASEAKTLLSQWMEEVIASELKCFDRFIQTLSKHIDSISHYFIMRDSSGFVEGFNNRVKVLKRRCYGLSGIKRLYQRIKLDTEGFGLFAPQFLLSS